jgi:hypothetical protein
LGCPAHPIKTDTAIIAARILLMDSSSYAEGDYGILA